MEEWNHNNHYHKYLLGQVPSQCRAALDIGCGRGQFAALLSNVSQTVDAINSDETAIDYARHAFASHSNLSFSSIKMEDCAIEPNRYDFISLIASLHYMELKQTLELLQRILRPGGIVAVLGIYKEATAIDMLYAMISVPLNIAYQLIKNKSISSGKQQGMIVKESNETIRTIKLTMNELLPNNRFRLHLFWRYSVIWKKPLYNT